MGIIFASFQVVNTIGGFLVGRYLTTIGPRFLYIAGILLGASCTMLFGALQWCPWGEVFFWTALVCRLVEAAGCSMCQTASYSIVANEFPDRMATVIGLLESVAGIGFMLGPTVGGALYDLDGFYLPFVSVGALFFISGLVTWVTLPKTLPVEEKDRSSLAWRYIKVPAVSVCGYTIFTCMAMISFLDPTLSNRLGKLTFSQHTLHFQLLNIFLSS